MINIHDDALLAILQKLPGNDVIRLTRVNKQFNCVINANQSQLNKPRISITAPHYGNCVFGGSKIYITTKKGDFPVRVNENWEISLSTNDVAVEFLGNFYKCVGQIPKGERLQVTVFLSWLFSRFDVEILNINQVDDLAFMVKEVMKQENCRIYNITYDEMLRQSYYNDRFPNEFLEDLSAHQRALQVPTKLKVESDEAFANCTSRIQVIEQYSNHFKEVHSSFNKTRFFHAFFNVIRLWICSEYMEDLMKVRFDFANPKSYSDYPIYEQYYVDNLHKNYGFNVSNVTENELAMFIFNPTIDTIRPYYDVRLTETNEIPNAPKDQILRLRYQRNGQTLLFYTEIIRMLPE